MTKTYMAKPAEVVSKWYIVDAAGKPLGRIASTVAAILRGKEKPTYTRHVDCGDHVIIINCDKAVLTGDKLNQKVFKTYSGHIGGLKQTKYSKVMAEKSDEAMYRAVKGMLPNTPLGRKTLKKLRVYKGAEHQHAAQMPAVWEI